MAAVAPNSPAAAAGLRPGDVVTSLAGHPVAGAEDVAGALRGVQPDQQVPVTVARGKDQVTVTVTVGSVKA